MRLRDDQSYLRTLSYIRNQCPNHFVAATLLGDYEARAGDHNRQGNWVPTFSGHRFWLMDPDPNTIDIRDIARTLSRIPRFNGNTRGATAYSVAQHCVIGSNLIHPQYARHFLLHDAPEYITGDIITPIKRMIPDYESTVEHVITQAIAKRFGLTWTEAIKREVKKVDNDMLVTEASQLLRFGTSNLIPESAEVLNVVIEPLSSQQAEQQFLYRFEQLFHVGLRVEVHR